MQGISIGGVGDEWLSKRRVISRWRKKKFPQEWEGNWHLWVQQKAVTQDSPALFLHTPEIIRTREDSYVVHVGGWTEWMKFHSSWKFLSQGAQKTAELSGFRDQNSWKTKNLLVTSVCWRTACPPEVFCSA